MNKFRLKNAENKYVEELQEWLTNPKNEDLPNESVAPKIETAFYNFVQELLLNEEECAEFISKGSVVDELQILPIVFEHFKSLKIYEAIVANCNVALSHKYTVESSEMEQQRKELLRYMQGQLGLI